MSSWPSPSRSASSSLLLHSEAVPRQPGVASCHICARAFADSASTPSTPSNSARCMHARNHEHEAGTTAFRLLPAPCAHRAESEIAALRQALTGRPGGQPTAAGLGAHIQRARIDAGSTQAAPHSYVFATGGISSGNVSAAASPGAHPGFARPLMIKTDSASGFTSLLSRSAVGANRQSHDALVQAYVDQYNARLTWPNQGRVRSPRTDDLMAAFKSTTNVDAIAQTLKTSAGTD